MEGSRDQPYLQFEEAASVFEVALQTRDTNAWKQAQKAVEEVSGRRRNRQTIKRVLNVALELMIMSDSSESESIERPSTDTLDQIAEKVGYNVTATMVSRYVLINSWGCLLCVLVYTE